MKIISLSFTIAIAVILSLFIQNQPLYAKVFASQLTITNPDGSPFDGDFSDGSGARLAFFLNDTASAVTVEIVDVESGSTVAQIEGGAMSPGLNAVEWDGSGSEDNQRYVIRVTAEQPNASDSEWTLFFDSGDIDIFTRGVAVVTDQRDPNFGLIFTSNDGGPLRTGINIYNPDGSFHDPFLVAADQSDGGTINYGTDAPLFATLDYRGRIYVTLKDLGQIMRINRDFSEVVVIQGLSFPTGLYLEGEGDDLTIYVAADNQILRAAIGVADSFDPNSMEVIAEFSNFFPRQVILDDDGALYTTLRVSVDLGSDGQGIRKYDISGNLPVADDDALWFLMEDKTFIANDLLLDRGEDPGTSTDDILYYCTRADAGNDQDGIWRINDINSPFPDTVRIMTEDTFYGGDENVQARATLDFDAAGNIVFMENANEHVFMLSPPAEGLTNSFTSTSADTFTVDMAIVGIAERDDLAPRGYSLEANFPNPFNPSTTIRYRLGKSGQTILKVYDLLGSEVKTLVNEHQTAGEYTAVWNGTDNYGKPVASGVYILTLKSGEFNRSQRMTLLK